MLYPTDVHLMKNTIFWGVTVHFAIEIHRDFGGTYCLYLQESRISQARNQKGAGGK
jgi:hypothetical protein